MTNDGFECCSACTSNSLSEEIGTQLEEPFTVLPMQAFCDKIYNWCMEIVSWVPGDNGRPMQPIKGEHQYFTNGVTGTIGGRAGMQTEAAPNGATNGAAPGPPPPAQVASAPQMPPPNSARARGAPQARPPTDFTPGSMEDFLRNQGQ